jgi:hypothetical protein
MRKSTVPGEDGPTRSHERIEAESGKSDRSYVLYMDQRCFRSSAEAAIREDEAAGVD